MVLQMRFTTVLTDNISSCLLHREICLTICNDTTDYVMNVSHADFGCLGLTLYILEVTIIHCVRAKFMPN